LARFFDRFPREQILVLRHEDVENCPERVAAVLHRFLGVTEMPGLARDLGPINATEASPREPMPKAVRRQLAERFHAANVRLGALLSSDFDSWNYD
jgi:hypothetical protein